MVFTLNHNKIELCQMDQQLTCHPTEEIVSKSLNAFRVDDDIWLKGLQPLWLHAKKRLCGIPTKPGPKRILGRRFHLLGQFSVFKSTIS